MDTEFEATFANINKDQIRERLKKLDAKLIKPEFLQRRVAFNVFNNNYGHSWARVRDEMDKTTMTFKAVAGDRIQDQKEINLIIDNFEKGIEFLEMIGCKKKSYQETKREIWKMDEVEIFIDEWPFLDPFVEIEGVSEKEVRNASNKLGFNYSSALFGPIGTAYSKKYGISEDIINNNIPKITFNMKNPFLLWLKKK